MATEAYSRIPFIQTPLGSGTEHPAEDENPEIEAHDETLFEIPQFQHYEETSNIQLFFDLFIVANLTSFTNIHEVNSLDNLATYIGFFCILWFTWCQVTMYDVRFSTDSIFERVAHTCHFGVMVGLAVIGPSFETWNFSWEALEQLSWMLMVSRFILFVQYTSTLYFSWRYRSTRRPLTAVLIALAVAIILYMSLGIAFATESGSGYEYVAWYFIAVFEVGAHIAIAGRWHVLSFKGTHLTERMTCLTLIILGEGVIGLTKSISTIEGFDFDFSPSTIGTLISALLIIYFVYQLYFDNVQLEHFGIIRQQIWTFLHFPFHMALVGLMEGTNQFVGFRHIMAYIDTTFASLTSANANTNVTECLSALSNSINTVFNNTYLSITQDQYDNITNSLSLLQNNSVCSSPWGNASARGNASIEVEDNIYVSLLQIIFDGYGFKLPESDEIDENGGSSTILDLYYSEFDLVFGYFFVSAGLVLIFLGILSWLSHSKGLHESRSHLGGIISKFVIGLGLVFLSTMNLTPAANILGPSAWTLPLLFFLLAIALILNHIPWSNFRKSKGGLPFSNQTNNPRRQNGFHGKAL